MTRRLTRFRLFLIVFLAGCADAPPSTVDAATETGTDRMVELLAQIAAGIDRQQNQFVASARVEELLAMDARPDLPGQMMFKSRLSEMLLYSGRFREATDSLRSLLDAIDAAAEAGVPEEARHLEYFSVPEQPDYVNHDFEIRLARSGKRLTVPADKTAADVLVENGYPIDIKCADGICGVCKCGLVSGAVEHRDFVLSKAQRASGIILCQSRAAEKDGVLELDL